MIGEIEAPGIGRVVLQDDHRWACDSKYIEEALRTLFPEHDDGGGMGSELGPGTVRLFRAASFLKGKVVNRPKPPPNSSSLGEVFRALAKNAPSNMIRESLLESPNLGQQHTAPKPSAATGHLLGFTGVIKDKIGRHQYYRNGKHLENPNPEEKEQLHGMSHGQHHDEIRKGESLSHEQQQAAVKYHEAHNNIKAVLRGHGSESELTALLQSLQRLTVDQLHALRREHGLAASPRLHGELVDALSGHIEQQAYDRERAPAPGDDPFADPFDSQPSVSAPPRFTHVVSSDLAEHGIDPHLMHQALMSGEGREMLSELSRRTWLAEDHLREILQHLAEGGDPQHTLPYSGQHDEEQDLPEPDVEQEKGAFKKDAKWHSKAKVVTPGHHKEAQQLQDTVNDLFGGRLEVGDVATLMGAPDDAEVDVRPTWKGLKVYVTHPRYKATRLIQRDEDGRLYVENSSFFMNSNEKKGTGLGSDVFAKQVDACKTAGAEYIETHAAKSPEMNGYYTWARLGYDQKLHGIYSLINYTSVFPKAQSVQDIMEAGDITDKLDEGSRAMIRHSLEFIDAELGRKKDHSRITGADWWMACGDSMFQARFDLQDDSRSMKALDEYKRLKQQLQEQHSGKAAP